MVLAIDQYQHTQNRQNRQNRQNKHSMCSSTRSMCRPLHGPAHDPSISTGAESTIVENTRAYMHQITIGEDTRIKSANMERTETYSSLVGHHRIRTQSFIGCSPLHAAPL